MKKSLIITLFSLLASFHMIAQESVSTDEEVSENVWEVKANALYLIVGAVEVSAERSLNSESALGLTVFLPYDKDVKDDIQYYISPYYRLYFGNKQTAGFFLEGFAMINSTDRDFIFEDDEDDFVTDLALGIGLGGKWLTKSGFVGEISFGVGRNLFNPEGSDLEFIGKGGISVGYRF